MDPEVPGEGDGVDVGATKVEPKLPVNHGASICLQTSEVNGDSVPGQPGPWSSDVVKIQTKLYGEIQLRIRAHINEYLETNPHGRNQARLEKEMGMKRGSLSNAINGKKGIGLPLVVALCRATGISPTKLLYTNPDPQWWPPGCAIPKEP